jgi:AraC-like DNA-binding protein
VDGTFLYKNRMHSWWQSVADPFQWLALFDAIPSVFFYTKDTAHRFMRVNVAMAQMHGCRTPEAMVGTCDADYHPPVLAAQYVEEDRQVMAANEPLLERIWLVHGADGMPRWFLSNKFPLRDAEGVVVGLAGVMWAHEHTGGGRGAYARLTPALDLVLKEYGQDQGVRSLAQRCNLSVSQFQREFRRCFGLTPTGYLQGVRLLMARWKLAHTDLPVGEIALICGFYDQSHFTRTFSRAMGLNPLAYRRRETAASRP